MSRHSSVVPAARPQSTHITPPPFNDPRVQAKEKFQRLFVVVSDLMTEFVNSKSSEEVRTNFDAIVKPLVRILF
jgi:hypothetical protein